MPRVGRCPRPCRLPGTPSRSRSRTATRTSPTRSPWIRDQHNNGFGFAPQYDYQTWAFASSNYGIFQWQEGNPQAPGLLQYQNGGTTRGGDWEEFYTNAGHPNTYIYEAIFADVNHYVQAPNYSFLVEGLWDIGAGTWQRGVSSASGAATVWGDWASPTADGQTVYGQSVTHCATPACSPEDQPPSCANNPNQVCQNYAVLQEYYPWGGTQGGGNYMGSVALYIGQKAPPTTDPINAPGGWQRGTINIGAHARDNGGLGMASLTLSGNTGQLAQAVAPCMYDNSYARGSHNDPCPQDLYGFSLDTTTMPDGYQPLYLNATNIADRAGYQQQAAILVDNTPPTATITPALAPFVGQTVNIAGTAQDNASGVANWTAQVNGPGTNGQWQTVCSTTTSQNSAYSCPWDTTTLPDGAYQVQATATDNAGNPYTTPIQNTTVDNTGPMMTPSGPLWDNRAEADDPGQLWVDPSAGAPVSIHATDAGAGVQSIDILVNGAQPDPGQHVQQSCATGSCPPLDLNWRFPGTSPATPGDYQITAMGKDQLGNSITLGNWTVTVLDPAAKSTAPPLDSVVATDTGDDGQDSGGGSGARAQAASASVCTSRSCAPRPAPAWYVNSTSTRTAAHHGCVAGRAQNAGITLLFFGQPQNRGGREGTLLFNSSSSFATDDADGNVAEAFGRGYYNCLPNSSNARLGVAISQNNGGSDVGTASGRAWGAEVQRVRHFFNARGYYFNVTGSGADDIESGQGFGPPGPALAWVRGFAAQTVSALYNAGSLDGCPPFGSCENGWSQGSYSAATSTGGALPLPEIYYKANAMEWQRLSLYRVKHGASHLFFPGPLSEHQAKPDTLPSPDAWASLFTAINRDSRTSQSYMPTATAFTGGW